ncbi:hypothetical protein PENTCL1PPCAC_7258, partial [Pristionchus entomophagus]
KNMAPIKIRGIPLKEMTSSVDSVAAYRKAYKTDQIQLSGIKYKKVDHIFESSSFSIPDSFIKTEEMTPEQIEERVDYELDEEDQVWIDKENKKRKQKKKKRINKEMLEMTMDRLEKETYFEDGHPHEMDRSESLDDECCVCGNGDVENTNQIIYCDMCNVAVHQDCYGVPYIPEGQWLCRKCKLSPMEQVKCELCPLRDGAFKPTPDGKWAHVACAIWLNEVHFGNTAFLEPIEGVQDSLKRRAKLRCLVCNVKLGACLQCSKGSCFKCFHVTCAMKAGLQMDFDSVVDTKSPDGITVKRSVYCHEHGSVALRDNEFAKNKKRAIEAIHLARNRMLTEAATTTHAPLPTLDAEAKKRIEERVGDKSVVDDILGFWLYKRKKRCGLPLIRGMQKEKEAVVRVATPRGEMERKERIVEKAPSLVGLVQERGKKNLESVIVEHKITASLLTPLDDHLIKFIRSISRMDNLNFFRDDPMTQSLVNYNSIVKKPMYLSLMRKNAEKGLYKTEGEMKEHLDLIFNNCQLYNRRNEGVLIYAKEKQKMMNQAYSDLVEHLKYTRKPMDEMNLIGEVKKERVKEERKKSVVREVKKKEMKEEPKEFLKELRDAPMRREESTRLKRKAEEPKMEDITEIPSVKRDKRTRDKDNGTTLPSISPFSVFHSSTITPMPPSTFR